jgi:hypothetical protein
MNADDPTRADLAELARLLPAPAERDLREGRHHVLKEHLMSEIRLMSSPPAGARPARGRRRPALALTAMAAAAVAAVTVVALQPASTPAPGPSSPAARLLAQVAGATASQPAPQVRDSQFSYIRSWVSFESCLVSLRHGRPFTRCGLEKPHERQIWQSVSNLCVTGLLREYGQDTPLTSHYQCPYPGDVHDPTYRFLQRLPTSPRALLRFIERNMQGRQPNPQGAFNTIGDLIREAIAPPRVSAALYRAAALIPGVTVVKDATDAIGRHGIAVAWTSHGVRYEWIFSKRTHLFLGEEDINTAHGTTVGSAAVIQRAFVAHPGQTPR